MHFISLSIPNDHLPLWGKAGAKTCLLMNSKIINWDSKNYLSLLLSRVPRFWVLNKTVSSEAILALGIQSATHTIHSSEKNLHIMQILWLRIDNFPRRTPGWMQKSVSSWTELCRKAQNMHFNMSLISTISLLCEGAMAVIPAVTTFYWFGNTYYLSSHKLQCLPPLSTSEHSSFFNKWSVYLALIYVGAI